MCWGLLVERGAIRIPYNIYILFCDLKPSKTCPSYDPFMALWELRLQIHSSLLNTTSYWGTECGPLGPTDHQQHVRAGSQLCPLPGVPWRPLYFFIEGDAYHITYYIWKSEYDGLPFELIWVEWRNLRPGFSIRSHRLPWALGREASS